MSMIRTPAGDVVGHRGERILLRGWVESVQSDGGGQRIVLRDSTGLVALRADTQSGAEREAAIEVVGTVGSMDGGGEVEVEVDELRIVGPVLGPLPISEDDPLEKRLDWRFLDLRRPQNLLALKVQTTAERAMREVWYREGFIELHSPKIRPTPNKSGRELFTIEYFGRPAYLAQSPQFYKQMAMASGLERIFEIGPVFRANPLVTARHDTEFTSVDVEISWIDSVEDVMAFEERWLAHVVATVKQEHGEAIADTFGTEIAVPSLPFPRVTLEDARRIAEGAGFEQPPGDLDAKGERALGDQVAREHGHQFVFVTHYPVTTRPFYHMRVTEGSSFTRSFDLLWKGMEVTTGAQREHRRYHLERQAEEAGVPVASLGWYLDFFSYGCPPHGGFGLGLTRMLMSLMGRDDVREVTYLHRGPERLMP